MDDSSAAKAAACAKKKKKNSSKAILVEKYSFQLRKNMENRKFLRHEIYHFLFPS